MTASIEIFIGKDATEYVELVSTLRIELFQHYPYLYKGEIEYERNYMLSYTLDKRGIIAVARIDGVLAGISTGIPLNSDFEIVADVKKIFKREKLDICNYYYCGEAIIKPEFRGRGLIKLLSVQENLIKDWGFKQVCFMAIVREDHHPLKPVDYKCPNNLWKRLGFINNNLTAEYHWPTIQPDGSIKDTNNKLEFWTKQL